MTYKDFIKKYHLQLMGEGNDDSARMLVNFLLGMDFIYGTLTKEQAVDFMSTFYDCADEIYNSLSEDLIEISLKLAEEKKKNEEGTIEDKTEKKLHQA